MSACICRNRLSSEYRMITDELDPECPVCSKLVSPVTLERAVFDSMLKALEYYADDLVYAYRPYEPPEVVMEYGDRANEALKLLRGD